MVVHLIKTPEYELNDFNQVFDLLNSFSGAIKFKVAEKYSIDLSHANSSVSSGQKLSVIWTDLFTCCERYRLENNVGAAEFVALLTTSNNTEEWFSAFDARQRNIFVHCAEWELYTKIHHKYPVAYDVVANVLQAAMKLSLDLPNPNIHELPIGCMNDFCDDKRQVILKLRTADICENCLKKLVEEKVPFDVIQHALGIFERIREQMMFKQGFKMLSQPGKLIIFQDEKKTYRICIELLGKNVEIKELTPLYKALYIFYLNHPEGVALKNLSDHRKELCQLYKEISGKKTTKVNSIIDKLSKSQVNLFSQNKNIINTKIKMTLGEPLSSFYLIGGAPREPFKINLSQDLVDIPDTLKVSTNKAFDIRN
jgi:hypothetical protein